MKKSTFFFCLVILGISGCGQKTDEAPPPQGASVSAAASADKALDLSAAGTLKGKVSFEGTPPAPQAFPVKGNPECSALHPGGNIQSEEAVVGASGGLKNVFVYVKEGLEGHSFEPPSQPAAIHNTKCVYVPHVSGVQVNQPVELVNDDPTLHNMHSYSVNSKSWNIGLPFQGMKQTKKFPSPEVMVKLKCDVHPWMLGYVGILPHPYFAVTDEEGNFEIKNLPPGDYVIEAWQEKFGVQSQKITIGPRETKEASFSYRSAT